MSLQALLHATPLFANTPPPVLEQLTHALKPVSAPAGTILTNKGDPGDCMYLIASGIVRVHNQDLTYAELGAGEIIGEFSLLDTDPRSASLTAKTDAELYRLDQAEFQQLVLQQPEMLLAVTRYVLGRLRKQNESLEGIVAERTSDLQDKINEFVEANRKLAETGQHKNEIIRIVSHDIRSPLTGISSLAKLLQDNDVASDVSQVVEFGKLISTSAANVTNFVNDILDVAKLESGTSELKRTNVSLADFLRNTAAQFEPLTRTKGIQLQIEAPNPATAAVDKSLLGQAVNNMVSNSIKFTPQGGKVTLRLGEKAVDGQQYVSIQIQDTGIGIPADAIPHLFDKFNKVQRSGTTGEKGTGLGMSIAKQIIDLHEGKILVDSVVNEGTTFTILLPLN